MAIFVAFLRAINVGGTGLLPMKELSALCMDLGLQNVRTYIQSGNVLFQSALSERRLKADLERALAERLGKKVDVMVRTASELRAILQANPFLDGKPAQIAVVFLADPVPSSFLDDLAIPGREEVRPAGREIYVYYPDGMGRSKLKLASAGAGTARNLNTIAKLVEMTEAMKV